MGKNIILGGIFILSLVFLFGFVVAEGGGPYELSQNHTNIPTSNGTINPPAGTLVGGTPSNYVTLTQNTTMETTEGTKEFQTGTKIDCDHEPGYPDPCNID